MAQSIMKDARYERQVWHGSRVLRALRGVGGARPFTFYRHLRNSIIAPFLKKPGLTATLYKGDMRFWDTHSYHEALAYYLAKHQTFEEYVADTRNEVKEYIDLDFSVYFQCYNNKRATFASLQSFRQFYP